MNTDEIRNESTCGDSRSEPPAPLGSMLGVAATVGFRLQGTVGCDRGGN